MHSGTDPRAQVQVGYWPVKVGIWLLLLVGIFFLPPGFFLYYWIVGIVFSCIFLLLQGLFLVLFAFESNKCLTERMAQEDDKGEEGSKLYLIVLLGTTFLCYSFTLAVTIMMYTFFVNAPGCAVNAVPITFNLLFTMLLTGISILPSVQEQLPESGIFQPAMVGAYTTYLTASALMGQPRCNSFGTEQPSGLGTLVGIAGVFLPFASLTFAAFRMGTKKVFNTLEEDIEEAIQVQPVNKKKNNDDEDAADDDNDAGNVVQGGDYNYSFFHLAFFMVSFYVSCILTEWDQMVPNNLEIYSNMTGNTTIVTAYHWEPALSDLWAKLIASWMVIILYLWMLLAPVAFPDREFSMID